MKTIKVKFPSGQTANELFHYMGIDDEVNLKQRPEIAQRLAAKCKAGKEMELDPAELNQLIHEVDNALDIKQDHVGHGWSALQQYNLGKYLQNLKTTNQ